MVIDGVHRQRTALVRWAVVVTSVACLTIVSLVCAGQVSQAQQSSQQTAELNRKIAELKRQIADLNAKLSEKTKSSTLDQQAKCADRAYKDFDEWGFKAKQNSDFVGHYNLRLDRCFVQFQNTLETFFYREVFDAYSGKKYGEYAWQSKESKKYWEVPPFICHVIPLSGETQYCKSDNEFQELAKVYMGY